MRRCKHETKATKVIDVNRIFGDLVGIPESQEPPDLQTVPDYSGWFVDGWCEFGNCIEWNCPVCGCNRGGAGPVACPCDDTRAYHAMRRKTPFAIKPSAAGQTPLRRSKRR